MLRMLGRFLHSNYSPTADTGVGVARALLPGNLLNHTLSVHSSQTEPKSLHRNELIREQECPRHTFMLVSNPYSYRRRLPHLQKADAMIFATFCKLKREPFSPRTRDLVLDHCVYEHANRIDLYVAVIMPEHVHLLFRPLRDQDGWPFPLHKSCGRSREFRHGTSTN